MNRVDLLKEMRSCVGTQDPIVFFNKMVDVFGLLFDHIEKLEKDLKETRKQSALAIQWEPKVASDMLAEQIYFMRQDADTYFDELGKMKRAYADNIVTQTYEAFCQFWQDTLGWHPFLDYK